MKKILSLVLALLMSASAASFVGAAEEAAIAEEDTTAVAETTAAISDAEAEAQAQYADALVLLNSWGIYKGQSEDDLAASKQIKRYEMALFVSRISTGWTDDSKWVADQWYDRDHDTSGFDDLEGSGAINFLGALSYASQKQIILGYGNKKFGPEDGITYQDALTMAVRTLGYYNLAWPWGNIEKAVTLGLTKGIPTSVKYTDILNRGQVAQIIYNALFAQTKDGDTLAARNFNGDLDWKTIIITVAGKGYFTTDNEKIPEGYKASTDKPLGFRVVKDNGELDSTPYWVKNSQSFKFEDRIENYLGYAYKVLFTVDEGNYATVEMIKPLAETPVWNWGVTDGNYPITNYLADKAIVSKYNQNTYLNSWNTNYGYYEFILMNALQGKDSVEVLGNKYGVDWSASKKGNILERVAETDDADYVVEIDGKKAYFKTSWYWNDVLNAYFHYVFKDVDSKLEVVGIDILDQEDIEKMVGAKYTETVKAGKGSHGLKFASLDDTKTAYASLIPFALNDSPRANYGLFEEYKLGFWTTADIKCPKDDAKKPGFQISRLNAISKNAETLFADNGYTDVDWPKLSGSWGKTVKHEGIFEGKCDHAEYAFYWYNDEAGLPMPADNSYVIYSVDEGTGEIKIVKVIYDITDEKHDDNNFVATGIVRGYDIAKKSVIIGDKPYTFDYDKLADVGLTLDTSKVDRKALFTYFFKTLFNQYVTYVVVDGKLVYIELAGNSSDLIVVDSYAGLSSDGYIVVNGYDTKNLEYRQYRIGSYNGWVKGDYYYYPNQAEVDAAFVRGTLYTINSYDDTKDVYFVSTAALRTYNPDTYSLEYYIAELVQKGILADGDPITITLNAGYKSFGGDYEKAKSTDKYILICNPIANFYGAGTTNAVDAADPHKLDGSDLEGIAGGDYAPIIVYVGKGGTDWTVTGYPVKTGDTTILLNVDYANINGFNKDQYAISYVLFQTWDYEVANYDAANTSKAWYLLGASEYQARCFNLYTGEAGTYTAVNKDLRLGYAYPAIGTTIVNDIPYDAARLNYAVPGAYESGSKYVFGHGTIKDTLPDGTAIDYSGILWDADKVSQKILSYNTKLVPAKLGQEVKGLTTGTSVYLVSTYPGLYGAEKFELDKLTKAEEFADWAKGLDLASISFWYVHNVGGKTIFYIQAKGDTLKTFEDTIKATNAIIVETGHDYEYDKDTALIKATANVEKTTRNDVIEAMTIKSLVFKFDDNSSDEHGFTITGEDHNAIYLDSFEFGDNHECTKNDWNTAVVYDNDEVYKRVVGTLETITYDPHAEEGGCEMIKGVIVKLPGDGKVVAFPTAADADSTGKATATTTINVNFKDIDREDKVEVYNFNVDVTVTCTFNADGTIATSAVEFDYTTVAAQQAGDNAVVAFLAQ